MAHMKYTSFPLLLAGVLVGCRSFPQATAVEFPHLIESPGEFNGRLVSVKACAWNNMHGVVLIECGNPKSKPVALGIPAKDHPVQKDFERFFGVKAHLSQPHHRVHLIGRYEWHSGEVPSRILRPEKIVEAVPHGP